MPKSCNTTGCKRQISSCANNLQQQISNDSPNVLKIIHIQTIFQRLLLVTFFTIHLKCVKANLHTNKFKRTYN